MGAQALRLLGCDGHLQGQDQLRPHGGARRLSVDGVETVNRAAMRSRGAQSTRRAPVDAAGASADLRTRDTLCTWPSPNKHSNCVTPGIKQGVTRGTAWR